MNNKHSESRIRGSDYQSDAKRNGKSTIYRYFYVIWNLAFYMFPPRENPLESMDFCS